jgi:hypothetical protein
VCLASTGCATAISLGRGATPARGAHVPVPGELDSAEAPSDGACDEQHWSRERDRGEALLRRQLLASLPKHSRAVPRHIQQRVLARTHAR